VVPRFCFATDYDRLEKYLLRIFSQRKAKHRFRQRGKYLAGLREREGWPHLLYRPCQRRLKRFNEFKAKITATQETFQRGN